MMSRSSSKMTKLVTFLATMAVASTDAWMTPRYSSSTQSLSTIANQKSPTQQQLHMGFFNDLLKSTTTTTDKKKATADFEPVTIDPDYRVAIQFLAAGLVLDVIPYLQLLPGPLVTALGVLFAVQTARIRFRFNEENQFELVTVKNIITGKVEDSEEPGENIVVGGTNSWSVDTIVNYDFFPFTNTILVYFKETQTPSASWNEGPGKAANDPAKIAAGEAVPGQVHFFPAVCNVEQLREEFARRSTAKL